MKQTYNPILETVELARFRFGSPLRAPDMGTALVLERDKASPIVVQPGERVPEPRTGHYRRLHRIDVATRGLSFTVTAPSADAAFPFNVTVRFACRVIDPVAIARDGLTDMTAALESSLSSVVREVAARYDAMHPTAAESAIAAKLNSGYPLATVELSGFNASVAMIDAAEIVSTRREIRVLEMRRDAMRRVATGGEEEMLAHIMAIDDGNPMALLDRQRADRESAIQAKLEALRVLTNSELEDVDVTEVRKQTLSEFFPGAGISADRRSVRDRIERKSQAALESGKVVEGNVPDKKPDAAGEKKDSPPEPKPEGNGGRPNRLRGSLGTPMHPSTD